MRLTFDADVEAFRAEFAAFLRKERADMAALVRETGITAD